MPKRLDPPPVDLIHLHIAAQLVQTCRQTILRWILSGKIAGYRVGHRWRVSRRDVIDLIQPFDAQKHQSDMDASRPLTRRELANRSAETDRVLREAGIR